MSQLSYGEQAAAFAGMLADSGFTDKESYYQGEASAEIPFGAMVARTAAPSAGTPAKAIKLVDANSVLAGIVLHSHAYDARTELGTTGLKPKTVLSVLQKGRVWVNAEEAVALGDPVYVRHTAGSGTVGYFRNDADTANAVRVYGARFVTETTGAGLVQIEIDMAAHRAH